MSARSVTVVGAGLAGSLLALFLARRGIEVTVYEQLADPRAETVPSGRSINLALAERGIHALRSVGLADQVMEFAIPMKGRMVHARDGAPELQAYGTRPGEVIYAVHRARLNRLLLEAADAEPGVTVHFNQRLDGGHLDKKELHFAHTRSHAHEIVPFDVVIGADGAGSALRGLIDTAAGRASVSDWLGHGYKELTIPPGRDGGFRIEPNALHIWPRGGYMLIALPNHDKTFTATLFLPKEGEPAFGTLKDPQAVRAFFIRDFPDTLALIPRLEEEFFERPTGELGTVRCPRWHVRDRALVLGDAAHAIVPFHGQGMNCAFEDCEYLDRLIGELGTDWGAVFGRFEVERRADADAIAAMALENYVEMRDSVRDADYKRRKALAAELEQRHPDRFVPRYSLVMFHRLPYSEALERGKIQQRILDELLVYPKRSEAIDCKTADKLIVEHLNPL